MAVIVVLFFCQVYLIVTCVIGFLTAENVCLALKIKALSHLEAEILGNICFMAAILETGGNFEKLAVIFAF